MKNYVEAIELWYQQNKRELPWRKDKNPYHVWISEIMLQQTRIEAVINYYQRFMKEIPDISSLATVKEDKLLKLWEGLGYYNRAKNLKKAAIQIEEEYQGNFPSTYEEMLRLPGIGSYTASAISSICFNEKQATIDGNVLRVYTRFYADKRNIDLDKTKKDIRKKIIEILPEDAGEFNEAMMEIGETVCLPNGLPRCKNCPLQEKCQANREKSYFQFPVKSPKRTKKEVKYTVLLLKYDSKIYIQQRKSSGLLENMWEFPNIEGNLSKDKIKKYLQNEKIPYTSIQKFISNTHIFTHQKWNMTSYLIESKKAQKEGKELSEIKKEYAIPTAFQPFLKALELQIKKEK